MNQRNIEDIYPLSPMQQGMLFHSLYDPEAGMYIEQVSCLLSGSLNLSAFERAWREVIKRHSILRTSFIWDELDEPLQLVHRQVDFAIQYQDWLSLDEIRQADQFEQLLQTDYQEGFNLQQAPLMRLILIRTSPNEHRLIWSHHHLLLDGWSTPILLKEVFDYYEAYYRGESLYVKPAKPYRDYIAFLEQQDESQAEEFWRLYLRDFEAPTPLVIDQLKRSSIYTVAGKDTATDAQVETAGLSPNTSQLLRKLAQQHGLTLNTLIQGAWGLLLSRYSGESDVLFGATVSGRPSVLPGAEEMVGLFINTLPVRLMIDPGQSVLEWLKSNQSAQAALRQFEHSPLIDIQRWSQVPPSLPLFRSILVFENYPVESSLKEQRGSLQIRDVRHKGKTNYPLTVVASPGMPLQVQFVYDPNLLDADAIHRMAGHYIQLLEGMVSQFEQPLSQIRMIGQVEEKQVIDFSYSGGDGAEINTIHGLFETQVALTPQQVAATMIRVGEPNIEISYKQLKERSDLLAAYLIQAGARVEDRIGICIDRSIDMLVGMLAILTAGCAYVPLDPNYPMERLRFMIGDSNLSFLLSQSHYSGLLDHLEVPAHKLIFIDRLEVSANVASDIANLINTVPVKPQNAVYVIYTSGTTGQPKGVVIEHRSLVNHAWSMMKTMDLRQGDRIGQWVSISFDAAGESIYPALICGATVVFPPPEMEMSGWNVLKVTQEYDVSHLNIPAPVWHQMVDELVATGSSLPTDVRVLLVGGESPSLQRLRNWSKALTRPARFINAYGPTEATITSLSYWFEVTPTVDGALKVDQLDNLNSVPIGRPLPGVKVYLFDRDNQLVPVGIPGQIMIGGIGVAREYLNQPGLTEDKFIANPLLGRYPVDMLGERLYRTGDLGRYLTDEKGEISAIEFLGRADNQVKLRGFRIELEEIEKALLETRAVDEAAVILREDRPGDKKLVAYYTIHESALQDTTEVGERLERIREELKKRLPVYMVPSVFIQMDSLPVQPNGKTDRRALAKLPAPEHSYRNAEGERYVAPRTPVEQIIAGLWTEVLGIDTPGIYDDFFDSGGHSLKATQMLSRIRQTFQIELPLRSLYESPNIAGLAIAVNLEQSGETIPLPEMPRLDRDPVNGIPLVPAPLSFSQQRLWFLDQLDPGSIAYNIPAAVIIQGELDILALERSLNALIKRHESLRTIFKDRDGYPVQVVLPDLTIDIPVVKISIPEERRFEKIEQQPEVVEWALSEIQQPFDLASGPLLRIAVAEVGPHPDGQEHYLVFTLHHIIADGWSLGILIKEIAALYAGFHQGLQVDLPALPLQYTDFAAWQREWLSGDELERQLDYWKESLGGSPPVLDLPTDRPRPALKTSNGAMESFNLSAELTSQLNNLLRQEGVTAYMLLLAAFQTLLYRYSGQDDICVGSAIANRTRPEIEGLIGFFVNTLVLRTDLSGNPTFRELLQRVRETALGAYAHQDLPFETLVEAIQPQRNLSYTPLFQVGFDWQEVPIKDLVMPGLNLRPLDVHAGSAPYDVLMSINQAEQHLFGSLEYNTDLFDKSTIQRILEHFERLLRSIVDDPDQQISHLNILSESEKHQLLVEWNSTDAVFQKDLCIQHLFEHYAETQPEALAVIYWGGGGANVQRLTYGELSQRANLLGRYLRKAGVTTGALVGISIERSLDMIVAILGVLKSGGAYLPLDANYPIERLRLMIDDSQISVLITQQEILDRTNYFEVADSSNLSAKFICLDRDWYNIENSVLSVDGFSADGNLDISDGSESPDNLAYVIYTSGSTGKPKGTLLRHRGLCNLVEWQRQAFEISSGHSRILQFSPFSFDASVWEIFMALANGATLVMSSQEVMANGLELLRLLKDQSITTVTLPPSLLKVLPAEEVTIQQLPALKTVISAGEACTREIVDRWAPARNLFNAYGPTETTVCASAGQCYPDDPREPSIGRPIFNTHIYIVDAEMEPVPVGVPGELLVGGVSVAKGYLNRPEMSKEKFISNPFAGYLRRSGLLTQAQERLYRTGDLARYRPNGEIEFLGRIDQQVKVRGHRIELGEIETVLHQYQDLDDTGNTYRLSDVAVVIHEDVPGDKRIAAYVIPEFLDREGISLNEEQQADFRARIIGSLRQYLRQNLPDYMVPSAFVVMESFPLTPSGKVDRKSLMAEPLPKVDRDQVRQPYQAPRDEIELQLCRICSQLLNLEWGDTAVNSSSNDSPVGIWDNFFELGGHSLLATQFIAHVRQAFQVEIPLRTLFEHPTVAELSEEIKRLKEANIVSQVPTIQRASRDAHRMRQTESGLTSTVNVDIERPKDIAHPNTLSDQTNPESK